ncbi:acyl carrier protein [Nocardioides sp. Y6]|uniref:Acyl carrier protein n=1 Tax=Nocardioides malaquae TaxID=2773426 RepID=A0ABR9RRH1_9ACTN|nr:acyl carrier protein [Nocardioides malaquae]MBE7324164.1 acyl carrier protein [Nocardioides malaquae]
MSTGTPTLTRGRIEESVRELLAETLEMDPEDIELDVPASAYGLDSVTIMRLVEKLARRNGLIIDPDEALASETLADLATRISTLEDT